VGDTGAAKVNRSQTAATALGHEAAVADAMVSEIQNQGANGPAFFFHLGDVIYNFGEAQYYYDQFYEPFRAYDRPIFAIPGNHDGMIFGQGSSAPQVPTLDAFLTNFCAAEPGPSPDAGGLIRSVMTQPGVYFTLDAPFVSIIGLYSNVLDGPGIISSQGGRFPIVDDQLDFLKSELTRLKPDRQAQKRAIILAVHHPPLSADAKHGGSTGILKDLDACCKAAGLWPDVLLSGHAHLYQRFTRNLPNGQQAPYIVAGSGGFAATTPKHLPPAPITVGDYTLEINPIVDFGYLTVETDARTITLTFKTADGGPVVVRDSVSVNLKTGRIGSIAEPVSAKKSSKKKK
jgi:predicted phosphodiesterase